MSRDLLAGWPFALDADDHPRDHSGEIVRHVVDDPMALSERVLAVIARVTPEELAETRRWCELGDRVRLLSDLTEGRVSATPLKGKRTVNVREHHGTHKGAGKLKEGLLVLLGAALVLGAHGCAGSPADDEGRIGFERNSEFAGPELRVFLTLEDGRRVSVNAADDAVDSRSAVTPVPGHQARDWTFIKEVEEGTSIAYALVSWDGDNPADYLMAGWWAEFPGQHLPELSFRDSIRHGIVDGPEIDPSAPPELPLEGQATYTGQAGGLYTYVPGTDWGDDAGANVIDEYEGAITITADFADATLRGCLGCTGDLVTRRAHFGIFLGDEVRDVRAIAAHYELHLGVTPFNPDGTFEHVDVTVKHPDRTVTHSEGFWGGLLSNIPDQDGNPRLVSGFSAADFEESDGSVGEFLGAFVALSEPFRASGR